MSCIYRLIPDFYLPLKFLRRIALRSPIRWTPLTDTREKQANRKTDVSLSVWWSLTLCARDHLAHGRIQQRSGWDWNPRPADRWVTSAVPYVECWARSCRRSRRVRCSLSADTRRRPEAARCWWAARRFRRRSGCRVFQTDGSVFRRSSTSSSEGGSLRDGPPAYAQCTLSVMNRVWQKTKTQSFDFVISRLFVKLVNTSDIVIVKQCQEQKRTGPPGCLTLARWAGWSCVQVGRYVKCWSRSNDLPR